MRIPQIYVTCDEPGCAAALVIADSGQPLKVDALLRMKGWAVMLGDKGTKYEYCPAHRTMLTVVEPMALEGAVA